MRLRKQIFFVASKIRVEKCMDEHNVVMCEKYLTISSGGGFFFFFLSDLAIVAALIIV